MRQFIIVAAEEAHIIAAGIIIVIDLEAQADLRYAIAIDILEGRTIQPGPVPTIEGIILDITYRVHAGRAFEIRILQAPVLERPEKAERARANIHPDILVRRKRIFTDQGFPANHEQNPGDHSVIRQVIGGEV